MKIRFIGTGSGKSSQLRFHTSFLLDSHHKLLIDTGDGISKALQFSNIDYTEIDSIIITHFHPDHISGLPMLLNQMKMDKRKEDLFIYVFETRMLQLHQLCELNLISFEKLGFDLHLKPFSNNQSLEISESLIVIPRENSHLDKFPEDDKCFSLFFENYNIHYTSDIGAMGDLLLYNDKSAEYIISECTHISPAEILKVCDVNYLKNLFLVHIESEKEKELKLWYDSLNEEYRSKIVIAYDGLNLNLKD